MRRSSKGAGFHDDIRGTEAAYRRKRAWYHVRSAVTGLVPAVVGHRTVRRTAAQVGWVLLGFLWGWAPYIGVGLAVAFWYYFGN